MNTPFPISVVLGVSKRSLKSTCGEISIPDYYGNRTGALKVVLGGLGTWSSGKFKNLENAVFFTHDEIKYKLKCVFLTQIQNSTPLVHFCTVPPQKNEQLWPRGRVANNDCVH